MIKEDYVSFEVAKLLKEKGFDSINIDLWYGSNGEMKYKEHYNLSDSEKKEYVPCITHQMAMKWLREIHNINIEVFYVCDDNPARWAFEIIRLPTGVTVFGKYSEKSYENAEEAGIKYCLENLI